MKYSVERTKTVRR